MREKEVAIEFLDRHPEVAAAASISVEPDEVLRQARIVLRLHAETRRLVPTLPGRVAQLHARAEVLARDVCRLFGVDPGDQSPPGPAR